MFSEKARKIKEQICLLDEMNGGLREIIRMVGDWETLYDNLPVIPRNCPVVLPNYLWIANSGLGITRILSMLSEYLEAISCLEFSGDVRYFEFVLDYSENKEQFPAFERFIETVETVGGFRGNYKGIVCIDVTEWMGRQDEKRFIRFLEYLEDNSDDWLVIFLFAENDYYQMETILSSFLRIRTVKFGSPQPDRLINYIKSQIEKYGMCLSEAAGNEVEKSIGLLLSEKTFDGYNTLNDLVLDIIYDKCLSKNLTDNIIGLEDIKRYMPEGEWTKRLKLRKETRRIGFSNNK